MGNPDHSATAINFVTMPQSFDYNKFEKFSNLADEISAKCEVLVVILDWYGFEFSIKGALKENTGQKTQLIYKKLKLLITEKFRSHFKVTLGIRAIKLTWWNRFSKKWRETLLYVLTSQTIYLANLDSATAGVTS